MKLKEEQIIEKLKNLRRIQPDATYVRRSRFLILGSKEIVEPRPSIFAQVTQSLSFAFEVTLVAALFLIVILGGAFGLSKTLFLPPLQVIDEEALVSEADAITKDINLQLSEIAYFGVHKTSTERLVALDSQRAQLKKEEPLLGESTTDQEIDQLLNQVIHNY